MKVRRLKLRITSLQRLIDYLKEKALISETSESVTKASLDGPAINIFERMLKSSSSQKYNPILRSFALTLAFYSPKAYEFGRNTFNKRLPHLGTISRWYESVDASPGFSKEAPNALILKQANCAYPILCNLVMDEMSIRKQVEWTGKKFTGYVDIGTQLDSDTLPWAREALVFMLVAVNASWKILFGYILIDGLTAVEKAQLVTNCLEFVNRSGVTVKSLTFDEAPSNISMCEHLGAKFANPLNLQTMFSHPVTKEPIFIFLDPCHMIKLVRNCLASKGELTDGGKNVIKWEYIVSVMR